MKVTGNYSTGIRPLQRVILWAAPVFLIILSTLLILSPVVAAEMPFTYSFVPGTDSTFNQLVIKFTSNVSYDHATAPVGKRISASPVPAGIEIFDGAPTITNNTMSIDFKNIDLLDYQQTDYLLTIPKGALGVAQLQDYQLPFSIFDLMPGFKKAFVDVASSEINNIFKTNAPRDIKVKVPKAYITSIETIHRYQGVVPDDEGIGPALTNIDVTTDQDVATMKVAYNNEDQYARTLEKRKDLDGFSTGQAGMSLINQQTATDFTLTAFDHYGKFLEERAFKLKVKSLDQDYLINDYLSTIPSGIFGETFTLYDLMQDKKLFESIISRIPVSKLDSLGISYQNPVTDIIVQDAAQLQVALANDQFGVITLAGDINDDLLIDRDVSVSGGDDNAQVVIQGDVTLGSGKDRVISLKNISITGDLTIDVGKDGSALLDGVTVSGETHLISGGTSSIVLKDFHAEQQLVFEHASPIRMVADSDSRFGTFVVKSDEQLILEGEIRDADGDPGTTVEVAAEAANLVIKANDLTIDSGQNSGTVEELVVQAATITLEGPFNRVVAAVAGQINADNGDLEELVVSGDSVEISPGSNSRVKQASIEADGANLAGSGAAIQYDSVTVAGNDVTLTVSGKVYALTVAADGTTLNNDTGEITNVVVQGNVCYIDNGGTIGAIDTTAAKNVSLTGDPPADATKFDQTGPVQTAIDVSGKVLTLTFNEQLNTATNPSASDFKVKVNGITVTITKVKISDQTVTLTLTKDVADTDVVSVELLNEDVVEDQFGNEALLIM